MAKIKELPVYERPREKACRYGIETLSNDELLALLLGTGTIGVPVLELAHKMVSENGGLFHLFHKPYEALLEVKGVGPGKALILSACFELSKRYNAARFANNGYVDSQTLFESYGPKLRTSQKEMFVIIILNRKQNVIHEEILYTGSECSVDCNPIEIITKVIHHGGKYFYIIHNHPSGNCSPSSQDVMLTSEIIAKARQIHITLLDHLIIGIDGYYSFTKFKKEVVQLPN